MEPEELREIIDRLGWDDSTIIETVGEDEFLVKDIFDTIAAAVAAEHRATLEQAAKVADKHHGLDSSFAADAIRALP